MEGEGIEILVIDPAIDHVDALRPFSRSHVDKAVAHKQIAALDQLNAKLVGEERVLIVG